MASSEPPPTRHLCVLPLPAMPQVVDLPPIGQDQRGALASLVRICKDIPAKGESFKDFRSRLRAAKLWDRERPITMLRFLGVGGYNITPSAFMQAIAAASTDDDTSHAIMDRIWHLNPLLAKTISRSLSSSRIHPARGTSRR